MLNEGHKLPNLNFKIQYRTNFQFVLQSLIFGALAKQDVLYILSFKYMATIFGVVTTQCECEDTANVASGILSLWILHQEVKTTNEVIKFSILTYHYIILKTKETFKIFTFLQSKCKMS